MINLVSLFEYELNTWDWVNTYTSDWSATQAMCKEVCTNAEVEEVERLQRCIDESYIIMSVIEHLDLCDSDILLDRLLKAMLLSKVLNSDMNTDMDFKINYHSSRLSVMLEEITQELIDLRT